MSSLVDQVRDAGVVGAGGAGFPTHVKISGNAGVVIANGAECEPLLRVDRQIMDRYAGDVVRGLLRVMEAVGAGEGVIALKEKYRQATASLEKEIAGISGVRLHLLENFYPAGDEQVLIQQVTGKVVPEGGIPLDVGVLVQNVATLRNIEWAARGIPVTEKIVTVTGAVPRPATVSVPIGTPVSELIRDRGGAEPEKFEVILGGPVMGRLAGVDDTIGKTTGAVIVLPADHPVVLSRKINLSVQVRRARSVCDQCLACTERCPRFLLGHEIEPHRMMRAVMHDLETPTGAITQAYLCCGCRLCEYACPVLLSPVSLFSEIRRRLAEKKVLNPHRRKDCVPHEWMEMRRVPVDRLLQSLHLEEYDREAPLSEAGFQPRRVSISLQQHIGAPAIPAVDEGDRVRRGDRIAEIPEGRLGATLHASIDGTVRRVRERIVIEKG